MATEAGAGGSSEGECVRGQCQCGGVRYAFRDGRPGQVLVCHCGMCRHCVGAPGIPFVAVRRATLEVEGDTLRAYRASADATRRFCGHCGASMFMDYDEEADTTWVMMATIDSAHDTVVAGWLSPGSGVPVSGLYMGSRAAWEEVLEERKLPGSQAAEAWIRDPCNPCKPRRQEE